MTRDKDTIERHMEVAEQAGAVWWGLVSQDGGWQVSEHVVDRLRGQIDAGEPTLVYLSGPTYWQTNLLDIQYSRDDVDEDLVPPYYSEVQREYHLWVKLSSFTPTDRDSLLRDLDPETKRGKPVALSNQTNPLYVRKRTTPRFWWVNQGSSYARARQGGYIWAPLLDKVGKPKDHWKTMAHVRVGDFVINYANGNVRAVSSVVSEAQPSERPDPIADQTWSNDGLRVGLSYNPLSEPVALTQIPLDWRLREGGPFRKDGAVNEGYLFPLSDDFVHRLASATAEAGSVTDPESEVVTKREPYAEPPLAEISKVLKEAGLRISDDTLRRYHLSLKTRGFVVLAGVSGTGKTWLADAYGEAVGARRLIVPVAPNWTTNEDLLGYQNPLDQTYHDTEFSLFLRAAAEEWEQAQSQSMEPRPFHLILDEMNLARVEYYFAKFLSAMELRARPPHGHATVELTQSDVVRLPPNLRFIGTVNVDETTHGFADKVYDRSQLIELTIDRDAVLKHLAGLPYQDTVAEVWQIFSTVAPFAFRVLDEIKTYVAHAEAVGVDWQTALDEQLLQKVLTKIKGTDLRLGTALTLFIDLSADRFALSHAKASSMQQDFNEHGFTSYF